MAPNPDTSPTAPKRRRKASARREFGAVETLPSGRWRARYTGPDGRLRSAPVTFTTRSEADRWLTMVRADMLRGQWSPPEAAEVTLGEYVTGWLRGRAPRLRPRTRDLYARAARRWLLAPVGEGRHAVDLSGVSLRSITPPLVREWHAAVTDAAHASAAARKPRAVARSDAGATAAAQAYRLLHAIMAQAVDDGLLSASPVRISKAGHVDHPERLPLTPEAVRELSDAVALHYRAAVLLSAYGGLRPGETFALTRADLDTTTGLVTIRRTLTEIPGQPPAFGPPKTTAGRRTVALPAFVTAALIDHLTTFTRPTGDALVFTTATGRPVTSPARSNALRTARQHIDRPDLTWHHLRHTGATLAAQAGATTAELQRRIGHASPRAAAIYQHATIERDHTIAAALDVIASGDVGLSRQHRAR